ncbi:probable serine/threonine-protein kinase pkgA [Scylla paramamosain]|uniref:probable serine/threonine-protein kinase pkgA n=1 Tax=Scylla paramamosain TaxID=85552 RepID=UPI0030834BB7
MPSTRGNSNRRSLDQQQQQQQQRQQQHHQQQTKQQKQQRGQQLQRQAPQPQLLGANSDPNMENLANIDECELTQLTDSLSEESKVLVKVLTRMISMKIKDEIKGLKDKLEEKDSQIASLKEDISQLNEKIQILETNIDSVDQYERRDTIIVSGPVLQEENPAENAANIITSMFKDHLKVNISYSDINIAHRIGSVNTQRKRPIIVKLTNRSLKHDLIGACIKMKPQLYINESLTPKRLSLFKNILNIRREHRDKFQQCHTKDGKIIIKLKNSTVRHEIIDERTLLAFLDKYPQMKDSYLLTVNSA